MPPRQESKFKLVRTYSAGVFFGEIVSRKGKEVVMKNARRIWYWDGAATLSQLAQSGTSTPQNCKYVGLGWTCNFEGEDER